MESKCLPIWRTTTCTKSYSPLDHFIPDISNAPGADFQVYLELQRDEESAKIAFLLSPLGLCRVRNLLCMKKGPSSNAEQSARLNSSNSSPKMYIIISVRIISFKLVLISLHFSYDNIFAKNASWKMNKTQIFEERNI